MSNDVSMLLPAATLILLRDGAQGRGPLEVLMAERHEAAVFGGAFVFPGGKVDQADYAPALLSRLAGADRLDADAGATRIAVIRETFEETGILLARARGEAALLARERVQGLWQQREAVNRGDLDFVRFLENEDLILAGDLLVHFAHWITPNLQTQRFDTHFFIAAAPEKQAVAEGPGEFVEMLWIEPRQALADGQAGTRKIIPPTFASLDRLLESGNVEAALAEARATVVSRILPEVFRKGGKLHSRIPPGKGFRILEYKFPEKL